MNERRLPVVLALLALAACTDSVGPGPQPQVSCTTVSPTVLAPGESAVIDPVAVKGCIRLPAAGAAGAEHLYVALSAAGREADVGVSTTYTLAASANSAVMADVGATAAPLRLPTAGIGELQAVSGADAFHDMLRARERELSASPAAAFFSPNRAAIATVPPTVGAMRDFQVCQTTSCSNFVTVRATAQRVGPKGAIYVDNTVPVNGYTPADIDSVGTLFDSYLYPIDTTAFGRESDLDNNGVVVVLLTPAVNRLSPSCNQSGSVILGYFFGSDLLPSQRGSNAGEIFYGLVPDPTNSSCTISRTYAKTLIGPTFIHEFQHMISFNQHVLLRGGLSEDTWLNEGLSHLAEELGARQIPDALCIDHNCMDQFANGDLQNGYKYLVNPEATALVEDSRSTGELAERGANWLFVRWLADHFGTIPLSTNFTRAIVATNNLGAANVAAITGQPFPTLVTQWQLANYLDNLPGFTPASPRLQYLSWDFRATYLALMQQRPSTFGRPYPLVPDSTRTGTYHRNGVLRDGSGRHLRLIQAAGAPAINVQLSDSLGRSLTNAAVPRIGLVRIR